jgi:hypothetical protein
MYPSRNPVDYLLNIYHNDPRQLTDEQKRQLSKLAWEQGKDFEVESKPISKALFDLVDTAVLGLIPNDWRPYSIGQEYHGETGIDKFAGGAGTVAGFVPGFFTGGLALKGAAKLGGTALQGAGKAKAAWNMGRAGVGAQGGGKVGQAIGKVKEAMAKARSAVNAQYYKGYNSVTPKGGWGQSSPWSPPPVVNRVPTAGAWQGPLPQMGNINQPFLQNMGRYADEYAQAFNMVPPAGPIGTLPPLPY